MSFANPEMLYFGWAAVILVALYLIGMLRKRSNVAAEPIWTATFAKQPKWNRWRKLASLLCHLLALATIVLAAADLRWYNETGRPVVVIVDVSASTLSSHSTDAPTRYESIYAAAWQLVEKRPRLQKMAILSVGSNSQWRCQFTTDQDVLRQAIPREPTHGSSRMQSALELLEDVEIDGERPRIVIVGDGCYSLSKSSFDYVEQIVVGESVENQGISRFSVRPVAGQPGTQSLAIEIANQSASDVDLPLTITSKSSELFSRQVSIAANSTKLEAFNVYLGEATSLTASLNHPDVFAFDNSTSIVFSPRKATRVRLIGPQKWIPVFKSLQQYEFTSDEAGEAPDVSVVIGTPPSDTPNGKLLVFDPVGESSLWKQVTREKWQPEPLQSNDQGILSDLGLENAVIENYFNVEFSTAPDLQLLSLSGRPILSYLADGDVLVFHLSLNSSDVVKRGIFAVLVDQLVTELAPRDNAPYGSFSTSDLVAHGEGDSQTIEIHTTIESSPTPIDLLDQHESDLRQIQTSELTVADITLGRMLSLSPLFLLLSIAMLVLEWRCFQNRQLI